MVVTATQASYYCIKWLAVQGHSVKRKEQHAE
jgi:hypothetical protein